MAAQLFNKLVESMRKVKKKRRLRSSSASLLPAGPQVDEGRLTRHFTNRGDPTAQRPHSTDACINAGTSQPWMCEAGQQLDSPRSMPALPCVRPWISPEPLSAQDPWYGAAPDVALQQVQCWVQQPAVKDSVVRDDKSPASMFPAANVPLCTIVSGINLIDGEQMMSDISVQGISDPAAAGSGQHARGSGPLRVSSLVIDDATIGGFDITSRRKSHQPAVAITGVPDRPQPYQRQSSSGALQQAPEQPQPLRRQSSSNTLQKASKASTADAPAQSLQRLSVDLQQHAAPAGTLERSSMGNVRRHTASAPITSKSISAVSLPPRPPGTAAAPMPTVSTSQGQSKASGAASKQLQQQRSTQVSPSPAYPSPAPPKRPHAAWPCTSIRDDLNEARLAARRRQQEQHQSSTSPDRPRISNQAATSPEIQMVWPLCLTAEHGAPLLAVKLTLPAACARSQDSQESDKPPQRQSDRGDQPAAAATKQQEQGSRTAAATRTCQAWEQGTGSAGPVAAAAAAALKVSVMVDGAPLADLAWQEELGAVGGHVPPCPPHTNGSCGLAVTTAFALSTTGDAGPVPGPCVSLLSVPEPVAAELHLLFAIMVDEQLEEQRQQQQLAMTGMPSLVELHNQSSYLRAPSGGSGMHTTPTTRQMPPASVRGSHLSKRTSFDYCMIHTPGKSSTNLDGLFATPSLLSYHSSVEQPMASDARSSNSAQPIPLIPPPWRPSWLSNNQPPSQLLQSAASVSIPCGDRPQDMYERSRPASICMGNPLAAAVEYSPRPGTSACSTPDGQHPQQYSELDSGYQEQQEDSLVGQLARGGACPPPWCIGEELGEAAAVAWARHFLPFTRDMSYLVLCVPTAFNHQRMSMTGNNGLLGVGDNTVWDRKTYCSALARMVALLERHEMWSTLSVLLQHAATAAVFLKCRGHPLARDTISPDRVRALLGQSRHEDITISYVRAAGDLASLTGAGLVAAQARVPSPSVVGGLVGLWARGRTLHSSWGAGVEKTLLARSLLRVGTGTLSAMQSTVGNDEETEEPRSRSSPTNVQGAEEAAEGLSRVEKAPRSSRACRARRSSADSPLAGSSYTASHGLAHPTMTARLIAANQSNPRLSPFATRPHLPPAGPERSSYSFNTLPPTSATSNPSRTAVNRPSVPGPTSQGRGSAAGGPYPLVHSHTAGADGRLTPLALARAAESTWVPPRRKLPPHSRASHASSEFNHFPGSDSGYVTVPESFGDCLLSSDGIDAGWGQLGFLDGPGCGFSLTPELQDTAGQPMYYTLDPIGSQGKGPSGVSSVATTPEDTTILARTSAGQGQGLSISCGALDTVPDARRLHKAPHPLYTAQRSDPGSPASKQSPLNPNGNPGTTTPESDWDPNDNRVCIGNVGFESTGAARDLAPACRCRICRSAKRSSRMQGPADSQAEDEQQPSSMLQTMAQGPVEAYHAGRARWLATMQQLPGIFQGGAHPRDMEHQQSKRPGGWTSHLMRFSWSHVAPDSIASTPQVLAHLTGVDPRTWHARLLLEQLVLISLCVALLLCMYW